MFNGIAVEFNTKYVTVIDGKAIGTSRHIDYSPYHKKQNDLKALTVDIAKFIFVNTKGVVDEVTVPAHAIG